MIWNCALTGQKCKIRFEDWYDKYKAWECPLKCKNGCYKDSSILIDRRGDGKNVETVKNIMCRYYGEERSRLMEGSRWVNE